MTAELDAIGVAIGAAMGVVDGDTSVSTGADEATGVASTTGAEVVVGIAAADEEATTGAAAVDEAIGAAAALDETAGLAAPPGPATLRVMSPDSM